MNEISVDSREFPGPFFYVRTQDNSPDSKSAAALIKDFLACWTVRNTFLLTIIHPFHAVFVEQPELRRSLWIQLNFFESFKTSLFLNVQTFCIWLQNSPALLATFDSIRPTHNCFSDRRGLPEKWYCTVMESVDLETDCLCSRVGSDKFHLGQVT